MTGSGATVSVTFRFQISASLEVAFENGNMVICGNDPVNRHDPLGLADRATVYDVLSPALASGFHGSPYGSQKAAIRRSVAVRVPILQAAAAAGNTARTVGGAVEMFAGVAYSCATGGAGGVLGGGALSLNGLDNFNAGWNSLASGCYQPAVLERGITSVAGNGFVGNSLYVASQFGIGFGAPALGSRVNSLLESNSQMLSLEMSQGLMPLRSGEAGYVSLPRSPVRPATVPLALPAPTQPLLLMDAVPTTAPTSRAIVPYSGQTTPTSWPGNRGILGAASDVELTAGTMIDRFGPRSGTFAAPAGTPFPNRGLPSHYATGMPFEAYEVVQPFTVKGGLSAPAFGQPGLGTQFELPMSVQELIDALILKPR